MEYMRSQKSYSNVREGYNESLRGYMQSVYKYMSISLLITAFIALFTSKSETMLQLLYARGLGTLVVITNIGLVMYMSGSRRAGASKLRTLLFAYSASNGLLLSYIFIAYTQASIYQAFMVSAAMFGAMSIYGYTTKKDLSSMGSFMFMGVIGVFIASLVNIFMKSNMISFVCSIICVVAFTGLAAYDTQRVKDMFYASDSTEDRDRMAVHGALSLYLDVVNIFVSLLRLFGDRK